MKIFYSIVISILLLIPTFSNVFVYLNFKINQDEIAKTLCVKKEIKNNTCNGKCFLAKQLKKAADKEKKEMDLLKVKQEVVYTHTFSKYSLTPVFDVEKIRLLVARACKKTKSISFTIFHPPLL